VLEPDEVPLPEDEVDDDELPLGVLDPLEVPELLGVLDELDEPEGWSSRKTSRRMKPYHLEC
jgi:hypothetical protein